MNRKRIDYDAPLERVIVPVTGEKYHLSWANPKCIWVCVKIDMKSGWVKLKTPKSKNEISAKIECLRLPRKKGA